VTETIERWSKDLSVHDVCLMFYLFEEMVLCVAFDVLAKFVW
jgi:hypothetical protein